MPADAQGCQCDGDGSITPLQAMAILDDLLFMQTINTVRNFAFILPEWTEIVRAMSLQQRLGCVRGFLHALGFTLEDLLLHREEVWS